MSPHFFWLPRGSAELSYYVVLSVNDEVLRVFPDSGDITIERRRARHMRAGTFRIHDLK